jgi:hypothetical protein
MAHGKPTGRSVSFSITDDEGAESRWSEILSNIAKNAYYKWKYDYVLCNNQDMLVPIKNLSLQIEFIIRASLFNKEGLYVLNEPGYLSRYND